MKCEKCGKELPTNSKKNGVQYYYCRNCKMSCSDKPHEPKPLNFDAYVARQLVKNCIYKTNEFTHSKWTKNQIARLLGYRYQDIKNWLKLKNLPTISKKKFENYLENRENGYDILCVLGYRTADNPSENLKKIVYRKAREKKDTSHIPKERDVFFHINEPEYLRLVNMTITNRKEAIFVLGALLGCRTREILGAKYTDIDYENKTIYFQRAISFEKESVLILEEKSIFTPNKKYPLTERMLIVIEWLKTNSEQNRQKLGSEFNTKYSDFLCIKENGEPASFALNKDTKDIRDKLKITSEFAHTWKSKIDNLENVEMRKFQFKWLRYSVKLIMKNAGVSQKDIDIIFGRKYIDSKTKLEIMRKAYDLLDKYIEEKSSQVKNK